MIIALVLALAACTRGADGADDPATPHADAPATQAVPDGEALADEPEAEQPLAVVEIGDVVNHPNGVQIRLERFELTDTATVVLLGITNGAPFPVDLDRGNTLLQPSAADGADEPGELTEPLQPSSIAPGEDAMVALRFTPTAARMVALELNVGAGGSPDNPHSRQPSFALGPYDLDAAGSRPPLPPPSGLALTANHPNGTELQVSGIAFSDARIGLRARVANGASFAVEFPAHAPHHLLDDLGNRYPLLPETGQDGITVAPAEAVAGVLVFAGRIHPDATELQLALNDGGGGSPDNVFTRLPAFDLGPIPAADDGAAAPPAAAGPATLTPADEIAHPQGTQVRVEQIRFEADTIQIDLEAANAGEHDVVLFANQNPRFGYAIDDLGNRYPLVPPEDNAELAVAAGTALQGTLVFSGRLAHGAAELAVLLNDGGGGSPDNAFTRLPAFRFGPYPVEHDGHAGPTGAPIFAVGLHTHLVDEAIAASAVEQITLILSQFDAAEVDGGILLTLPDAVLFDFDRADLRADARGSVALIAEVLRHYDPDAALVTGHTDAIGSDAYNLGLSQRRAQAVVEALVADHGIDAGRLKADGRGFHEPVAPNTRSDGSDDPNGRQLNRRVEVLILTDRGLPGG